jgi:hypothetical protein
MFLPSPARRNALTVAARTTWPAAAAARQHRVSILKPLINTLVDTPSLGVQRAASVNWGVQPVEESNFDAPIEKVRTRIGGPLSEPSDSQAGLPRCLER